MFSFTAQKKLTEIQPHIRRLCDLTAPNSGTTDFLERSENRSNRAIPTLVCPWVAGGPLLDKCTVALTKDLSDRGAGVILGHPISAEEVALGFFLPAEAMAEPWFFLGRRKRDYAMGGGFWLIGFEFTEFMNVHWQAELEPLVPRARKLLPPSAEIDVP